MKPAAPIGRIRPVPRRRYLCTWTANQLSLTVQAGGVAIPCIFNKWLNWPAGSSGIVVDSSVLLRGQNAIASLSSITGDDRWTAHLAIPSLSESPRVRGANVCGGNYLW